MNPLENRPDVANEHHAWLSALADGRADACDPALAAWSHSATARSTWHAYHLIGDVLRSEDLAMPVQRDEAFLQAFRQRLAQEPVVLAPQALPERPLEVPQRAVAARPHWRWGVAAAVAGVAMVGGAVMTVQRADTSTQIAQPGTGAQGTQMVAASARPAQAASSGVRLVSSPSSSSVPVLAIEAESQQWQMLDERVLRDARLESLLRAHRGVTAVGGRVEPTAMER